MAGEVPDWHYNIAPDNDDSDGDYYYDGFTGAGKLNAEEEEFMTKYSHILSKDLSEAYTQLINVCTLYHTCLCLPNLIPCGILGYGRCKAK